MIMNAAKGRTQQQIAQELNIFDEDIDKLNEKYKDVLKMLKKKKNLIKVSNQIYIGEKPNPDFVAAIDKNYGDKKKKAVDEVNFKKDSRKVVKKINEYIARQTKNKIKDLLSPRDVNRDTIMIGVNAFFFKGKWEQKFDRKKCYDKRFTAAKNVNLKVKMMQKKMDVQHVESDMFKARMVTLPFKPNRFSLILILPKKRHQIDYVERKIKNYGLQQLFSEMDSAKKESVMIGLPKFKAQHKFSLNEALKNIGVSDMFTERADFSKMLASEKKNIKLSSIIQDSYFMANENGAKAASATAATFSFFRSRKKPKDFLCDQPFIFLLRDETTKAIFLYGKIRNPKF